MHDWRRLLGVGAIGLLGACAQSGSSSSGDDAKSVNATRGVAGDAAALTACPQPVVWKQLSAGYSHTCGLAENGTAYCWGDNTGGALGNGSTVNSAVPVAVSGGFTFVQVKAGLRYTCGITATGQAYCWGQNTDGQLGTGTSTESRVPVAVVGAPSFKEIDVGVSQQTIACGLTTTGAAYCWGSNGWLGTGSGYA